jgi:RNA-directed DNA polymerase
MTANQRQNRNGHRCESETEVVFHKRNELRQAMYYIKKFGIDEHLEYKEIDQTNFLDHLLGK